MQRQRNQRACHGCGTHFTPKRASHRACDRQCGFYVRYGCWPSSSLDWKTCRACGAAFIRRHSLAACCSPECTRQDRRRMAREHYHAHVRDVTLKPLLERECHYCGTTFTPERTGRQGPTRTSFCSTRCGNRFYGMLYRQRKRTNGPAERFGTREIAERDQWTCHLCGGHVTEDDWSIDHLVPVAHGGLHTQANVALAHHLCNSRRGTSSLAIA